MEKLASAPIPEHPLDPIPTPTLPKPKIFLPQQRIPSTWQITSVSSFAAGEVGLLGLLKLEITQPDGKVFVVRAYGAGFGISLDPASWAKMMKNAGAAAEPAAKLAFEQISRMLLKGVGFNIGDYLQMFGVSLNQVARGQIIANPLNQYIGGPRMPTRYGLVGGIGGAQMFMFSAGASTAVGLEGGIVLMGPSALSGLTAEFIGGYGLYGLTAKVGAGVSGMLYNISSDSDL